MGLGKPVGECLVTSVQPVGEAAHTAFVETVSGGTRSALAGSYVSGVSGVRRSLAETSNMSLSQPPGGSVSPTDKRPTTTQPSDDKFSKFTHRTNVAGPKDLTLTLPVEDTMLSKFTHKTNAARPKHLTLTQPSANTTLAKVTHRTNSSRDRGKKPRSLERGIMLRDRGINLVDPGSPTDSLTVSPFQHVLIRARGNDNRFMTQHHGDVKMRVISEAQLCQAVFRIQDFLDEDNGCVLSTIFHVSSQSFLGVAPDTHDVILVKKNQPLGSQPSSGIVTLHSPSTDLDQPPFSGNTSMLGGTDSTTLTKLSSSTSAMSLNSPKIDTRHTLSSNFSFDLTDSGEDSLSLKAFSDNDDIPDWPPHPCCLFIIISESHACFKPAICQDESLSFRHSDGELVTVKGQTPWVFSFESPRQACKFFSNPQARNMLKKAAFVVLFVQSLAD